MINPLLLSVLFFSATLIGLELNLEKTSNQVEFLAVARPGGIKIRGKRKDDLPALKGNISLQDNFLSTQAKFSLDSLDTGIELRTDHMKKYLEVEKFPVAEFQFTRFQLPEGFKAAEFSAEKVPVEGKLTLHGITKLVKGQLDLTKKADGLKLECELKIPLNDFNIETPSFMGVSVKDDVIASVHVQSK